MTKRKRTKINYTPELLFSYYMNFTNPRALSPYLIANKQEFKRAATETRATPPPNATNTEAPKPPHTKGSILISMVGDFDGANVGAR